DTEGPLGSRKYASQIHPKACCKRGSAMIGPPTGNGAGDPILSINTVTKHFRGLTALSRVSFEVERGELLVVIGPNGAGKTTLFNVVSGFARPDQGRVELAGEPITALTPHVIVRRGLSVTFQTRQPLNSRTV